MERGKQERKRLRKFLLKATVITSMKPEEKACDKIPMTSLPVDADPDT